MILRLSIGKIKPGTWPDYERAYKANVAKTKRRGVKGLLARWFAEDVSDPNSGIAVSLWDNEASMRAYENSDFFKKEILPPLQPYFVNQFTTTYCEVRVNEDYRAPRAGAAKPAARGRAPAAKRPAARTQARPTTARRPAARATRR
jgi:heme-degrading monooxygenase HmoA